MAEHLERCCRAVLQIGAVHGPEVSTVQDRPFGEIAHCLRDLSEREVCEVSGNLALS